MIHLYRSEVESGVAWEGWMESGVTHEGVRWRAKCPVVRGQMESDVTCDGVRWCAMSPVRGEVESGVNYEKAKWSVESL